MENTEYIFIIIEENQDKLSESKNNQVQNKKKKKENLDMVQPIPEKIKKEYKECFEFFKYFEKNYKNVEIYDGKQMKKVSDEELKDYCVINFMLGWDNNIKGKTNIKI
jgi:hypothetical protein